MSIVSGNGSGGKPVDDLTGQQFGRYTVLRRDTETVKYGGRMPNYICQCACGSPLRSVPRQSLTKGQAKSCGCLHKEIVAAKATKHGCHTERLYKVWTAIKQRCLNPKDKAYQHYGARGVTICQEWAENYATFRAWCMNNGYQQGLTIERIEVNGNYEPGNISFIPQSEQLSNTRRSLKNRPPMDAMHRGYSYNKRQRKWVAYCRNPDGTREHLGFHSTEEEAKQAFTTYAKEIYGEIPLT